MTAPTDISVDRYAGKAFRRTAHDEFVDCSTAFAPFRSWENDDPGGKGWSYYEPGGDRDPVDPRPRRHRRHRQHEDLGPAATGVEFAAALDSIRIEQG